MSPVDGIAVVHRHCAVYTGPEAVAVLLDLVGWTTTAINAQARLLEPACGDGSFLLPAVARLIDWAKDFPDADLEPMVRAYEFEAETAEAVRCSVASLLRRAGHGESKASSIARAWVRSADFLLSAPDFVATHVVGNPPYMRWSLVPHQLRTAYETALPKAAARGDLCLAFLWKATEFARDPGARVGFLCADRWLRCAYGRDVRAELARTHHLTAHLEVHGLPVFKGVRKVGAYAAVTVLERGGSGGGTRFGKAVSLAHLRELAETKQAGRSNAPTIWAKSDNAGARLASVDVRELFDALDSVSSLLNDVGITVRCGSALGLAKAFIFASSDDVEPERRLPYVRSCDLDDAGGVSSKSFVANVWTPDGDLIDLSLAPRLAAHLERHRKGLEARACVSSDDDWYRTIDKFRIDRIIEPKVLIAGMSRRAKLSLDPGGHVASNALYCLTSTRWPLEALLSILSAGVLDLFGEVVSPRFSGGTKRFDGNVIRQVRLPDWHNLRAELQRRIGSRGASAGHEPALVADLYRLSKIHRATLERTLAAAVATSPEGSGA
ncbi:MAG: hypothetical protein EON93_01075 [Burkholderiales bacterium]|nr:MAG: hypothetical protein EON93_01075 [Burkholderiales bacterium]